MKKPKTKLVAFILTMPNVGSWNGKWTGEKDFKCRVRPVEITREFKDSYYYNFRDGWGANIEVREVCKKEATALLKKTTGFCGYDWMIDSILENDRIIT